MGEPGNRGYLNPDGRLDMSIGLRSNFILAAPSHRGPSPFRSSPRRSDLTCRGFAHRDKRAALSNLVALLAYR